MHIEECYIGVDSFEKSLEWHEQFFKIVLALYDLSYQKW